MYATIYMRALQAHSSLKEKLKARQARQQQQSASSSTVTAATTTTLKSGSSDEVLLGLGLGSPSAHPAYGCVAI